MKSITHAAILFCLANHANEQTGKCCPKVESIAEETGAHVKTVRRALRELESLGLLTRRQRIVNGRAISNQYDLNIQVTVTDSGTEQVTDWYSAREAPTTESTRPPTTESTRRNQKENQKGEPTLAEGALRGLESLALECIPPNRRRGGYALDAASARKLAALVDEHGEEKCRAALEDCGGAERPVAMLASKLRGGSARAPRASAGASLEKPWEKRQREAGHSTPWVEPADHVFVPFLTEDELRMGDK